MSVCGHAHVCVWDKMCKHTVNRCRHHHSATSVLFNVVMSQLCRMQVQNYNCEFCNQNREVSTNNGVIRTSVILEILIVLQDSFTDFRNTIHLFKILNIAFFFSTSWIKSAKNCKQTEMFHSIAKSWFGFLSCLS